MIVFLRPFLLFVICWFSIAQYSTETHASEADEVKPVVAGMNRAGLRILSELAEPSENVVISPFSAGVAAYMALAGARGDTQEELAVFLQAPRATERRNAGLRQLALRSSADRPDASRMQHANALFLRGDGDEVAQDYREMLEGNFRARLFTGSDIGQINEFVADETSGGVPRILDSLDPQAAAILVNAILFKGEWVEPFEAELTRARPFRLAAGRFADVAMMHATRLLHFQQTAELAAISLPYAGGRHDLVLLKPLDPAANPVEAVTGETLPKILSELDASEPAMVEISIPRFSLSQGGDLVDVLRRLGLELPFDRDRADFSAMLAEKTETERLHISAFTHRTTLSVDEAGTRAAGAAAVVLSRRSLQIATQEFHLDRPFLFLLRDRQTGAILFAGRVSDPRG